METYKVVKVFRKSGNKKVLEKGLSLETAKHIVNSFPDSNKSMVVFYKEGVQNER